MSFFSLKFFFTKEQYYKNQMFSSLKMYTPFQRSDSLITRHTFQSTRHSPPPPAYKVQTKNLLPVPVLLNVLISQKSYPSL